MLETSTRVLAETRWGSPVHLDTCLVEQAVLLAIERSSADARRRFRAQRDPIYGLDPGEREASFEALHARWFDRLGLADPILKLLCEQPSIPESITGCLVAPAARRKDQHADLRDRKAPADGALGAERSRWVRPATRPHLVIHLLAQTLIDRESLARLLRRELLFVADMLDPSFAYDPTAAVRETSGMLAGLVRERHELLWRVAVDGRLAARGHLREAEALDLHRRFRATFPRLGASCDAAFSRLFRGPRPTHPELVQLARHAGGEGRGPSTECPLCGMPAPRDQLERETLTEPVIAAARRDFVDWRPEDGMCSHCADLYELRERARPTVAVSPHSGPS